MSAKDLRKAVALRLAAADHARLAAYARAHGDKSLAAAARRALRAHAGLAPDRWPGLAAPPPLSRPPRPLRLQLEPSLRAAISGDGDADFAERVAAIVSDHLRGRRCDRT